MKISDFAIIAATFLGPIFAVIITRIIDDWRAQRNKRTEVFSSFMVGRTARLSHDFVRAMNLIDIEFKGVKPVLDAHSDVLAHFHKAMPSNQAEQDSFFVDRERLLTKLAIELGAAVNVKIERSDYKDGGYYPIGWGTDETENAQLRRLLISFLSNQSSVTVSQVPRQILSPDFPPRPS